MILRRVFTVVVIKDCDWNNPIFIKKSTLLNKVVDFVVEAIGVVQNLVDKK